MISHSLATWAALLATTAAAEPNLFFNWTFPPLSGPLEYYPDSRSEFMDGKPLTWDLSCSGDAFPLRSEDCKFTGRGGTLNLSDPSSFGTGLLAYLVSTDVWVYGETEAKTVERYIDSQLMDTDFEPTEDLVLVVNDMGPGRHVVDGGFRNSSVTVTKAIAQFGIQSDADSLDDMRKRTEKLVNFTGDRGDKTNYNETIEAEVNRFFSGNIEATRVGGLVKRNETFTFQVPDNTSFILINGISDELESSFTSMTNVVVSNLFHYAILDPTRQYTVSISADTPIPALGVDSDVTKSKAILGSYTLFEDVTFYSLKLVTQQRTNLMALGNANINRDGSPPGKKGPSAGAIAGAVVGAVAVVAVIVGLFIWWKKRRNANVDKISSAPRVGQIDKCAPGDFEIDEGHTSDTPDPTVAPFPVSGHSPDAHTPTASLVAAKMQRERMSQYRTDSGSDPSAYGSSLPPHQGSQGFYGRDSKHSSARKMRYPPEGSIANGSHGNYHGQSSQRRIPGWMDDAPVVQESDAGVVPQNLVPPKYDPAWRQEAGSTTSLLENDAQAPGYEGSEDSSSRSH